MPVSVIARNDEILLRRVATRDYDKLDMYLPAAEAATMAVDLVRHLAGTLGAEALGELRRELAAAAGTSPA